MPATLDVEIYRRKFRHTLLGKWSTIEGTFVLMSDTFEFYADGKGLWTQASGSGERLVYFDWKIKAPFELQILETKVEDPDGGMGEDEETEAQEQWHSLEYDFKIIENDCGKEIALCNKDSEYFYFANQRVGFSGENLVNG